MKKLSESVGLMVGILGIMGAAATTAYFTWNQKDLHANNKKLVAANEVYQSRLKALEARSSVLGSEKEQTHAEQVEKLMAALSQSEARVQELSSTVARIESSSSDASHSPLVTAKLRDEGAREQNRLDSLAPNLPSVVQPSFEADQFIANTISVRMADNRKVVRVTIEIQNTTPSTLYLAYKSSEKRFASTEAGDSFYGISIAELERIGSLRADTYEQRKNYTALLAGNKIRTIWEVPVSKREPAIQGKTLTLRTTFLWLSNLGLKQIPFQMTDIKI